MTKQLAMVRYLLIPRVVEIAAGSLGLPERQVLDEFYASRVNAMLENEEAAAWHFSAQALAAMFQEERASGTFSVPQGTW